MTSFSGDGALISNSSSTGAVTATLATAGAHKFWMNNTGSTAAPGYQTAALADLPSTVVNATSPGVGLAHFAGSTQTVTSSAVSLTADVSNILPLANGGTNCAAPFPVLPKTATYQVLATDFTCFTTITVASGTFTITLVASGTQPVAGTWLKVVNYGTGVVTIARSGQNINGGTGSILLQSAGATQPTDTFITSDGTNYFASSGYTNPMTTAGDIIYAGTTGLPTRLATGTAKQILLAGTTPTYVDFPDVKTYPAANCVNAVAGSGWSLGASGVVDVPGRHQ